MPEIPGVRQLTTLLRAFDTRGVGDEEPTRIFERIARECEGGVNIVSPSTEQVTADPNLDVKGDEALREFEGKKIKLPMYDGFTGKKLKTLEIDAAKFHEAAWHEAILHQGPRPDAQKRVVNFED